MALQLEKIFPNGAAGIYWKITKLSQNTRSKRLEVVIECFTDESYKNGDSIGGSSFIFAETNAMADGPYPSNQLLIDNTVKVSYDLIKVSSEFVGAQDV